MLEISHGRGCSSPSAWEAPEQAAALDGSTLTGGQTLRLLR